ncbi:MAG: hypothetical protein IH822_10875 [Chloroflexi bacterium]|nr:hypothetical protein [Chloroflexota bacterium]
MAQLGEERFDRSGLVLVGTVRKDGSPRISPVEPLITQGQLLLGMMWRSKKALDLIRDPRCVVHSTISNRDGSEGEFKLRGNVVDVPDPDMRERYSEALYEKIEWRPKEPYHLFSVDIESATFIVYQNDKQSVRRWP